MVEPSLQRAGVPLRYASVGQGSPVLFQHGLGGDMAQVAEVFPDAAGYRRLTLECRAQGGSQAGPFNELSIATFADDALALADAQGAARFIAGGISMGAAIALRLAALHPQRVRALILLRPAWLFARAPDNMRPFSEVAELLSRLPPAAAKQRFSEGATAALLRDAAPDNLAALLGFFERANPASIAALLSRIAADGPGVSHETAATLHVPALVIGNAMDAVHPLSYAATLAATLPRATLLQVTPKAQDRAAHAAEVRAAITEFLASLESASP